MARHFANITMTLWIGGLWMTGLMAYLLFDTLTDKPMAGMIAGRLFTLISYIGLFAGFYLLIERLLTDGTSALKQAYFWAIFTMLLLVLAGHFGIQPLLAQLKADALPNDVMQSVFANRFRTWHGVSSMAYLLECLLGLVVVIKAR
jgi:Domain of unknown function (DUF4149)